MGKRVVSMFMAVIMLCSMFYLAKRAAAYTLSEQSLEEKRVVVIDAGHGGDDPGKIGVNEALEKDLNLQIALRVQKLLEQNDVEVIMTRTTGEGLYDESASNKKVQDMKKRIEIINESKAPLAVSIHQNSYPDAAVRGAQVFYYEASAEGKTAAQIMQKELIDSVDSSNTRQEKANTSYYLLKKSTVPTIIVECGFLSNYEEAEMLCDETYQEKLAFCITLGILKYINT